MIPIKPLSLALKLMLLLIAATLVTCISSTVKTQRSAAYAMPDKYAAAEVERILKEGGNAVDAAIVAAFVLAVTFPEAGNIGGGGFMLARMGDQNHFLDYREKAPLAASRDMFLSENGEVIDLML